MQLLSALNTDLVKLEVLSLVFSNLQVACRKSSRPNQARLFEVLARSCTVRAEDRQARDISDEDVDAFLREMLAVLKEQRTGAYEEGRQAAEDAGDRGVLRTMKWGEKVTGIQVALITRLLKKGTDLLGRDDAIHVCTACGFLIVKGQAPEVCPICNAPHRQFISFQALRGGMDHVRCAKSQPLQ